MSPKEDSPVLSSSSRPAHAPCLGHTMGLGALQKQQSNRKTLQKLHLFLVRKLNYVRSIRESNLTLFIRRYKTIVSSFRITKVRIQQVFILLKHSCGGLAVSSLEHRGNDYCRFPPERPGRFESRLFVFSKVKISFISPDKSSALGSIGNSKMHWKYHCQALNEFLKPWACHIKYTPLFLLICMELRSVINFTDILKKRNLGTD